MKTVCFKKIVHLQLLKPFVNICDISESGSVVVDVFHNKIVPDEFEQCVVVGYEKESYADDVLVLTTIKD